jgi:molecular chaperone GrpE
MTAKHDEEDEEPQTIVDRRSAARMAGQAGAPPAPDAAAADAAGAGPRGDGATTAAQDGEGSLQSDLEKAKERADELYKSWQRSAADFQNFKRRVEQERGENARLAQAALVINLLPVYDDLDRAVATVDANLAGLNWVQGVVNIHRKFSHLMEAMEVAEIKAEGEDFDPARHEAVGQAPGEPNKVLHVVQKGYELGQRVVRPAMVIVGSS